VTLRGSAQIRCVLLTLVCFLGGCAAPVGDQPGWAGRLSLKVHSDPQRATTASFTLFGNAQRGVLVLTSPIGTTVARVEWAPTGASLDSGHGPRHFANLASLATELTGTNLPIDAFFAWLDGRNVAVEGWQANLDNLPAGIVTARRTGEAPLADLRVVLDR